MSLASKKERRGAAVSDLRFFPRVQKEESQDYRQQNNLPESKHTAIELAGLVMSVHVNDERSERDAGDQPDDLTFRIPHANFIGSPTPYRGATAPLGQRYRCGRGSLSCTPNQ